MPIVYSSLIITILLLLLFLVNRKIHIYESNKSWRGIIIQDALALTSIYIASILSIPLTALTPYFTSIIDKPSAITQESSIAAIPNFTLDLSVRQRRAGEWREGLSCSTGDILDYLIEFTNNGNLALDDIAVYINLPEGLEYIPKTTYVADANRPDGINVNDGICSNGINIGDYGPVSNAYIKFSAVVMAETDKTNDNDTILTVLCEIISKYGRVADSTNIVIAK